MSNLISRQTAQELQRIAQKRRYTFGNDEFSLEAAYHDCKLVFDGITDDNSFQEADTGLVLYYANEIIYALHEALECKDAKQSEPSVTARDIATIIENERDMMVILKNSEPCEDAISIDWITEYMNNMIGSSDRWCGVKWMLEDWTKWKESKKR